MNRKREPAIQLFFPKVQKAEERIEFHNHKIVPKREEISFRHNDYDDEWQQEYFVIYNSYVLDEKEF